MIFPGFCLFLIFCRRSLAQEQTYVVTSPKLFRAGASEKVVIQAFGYEQEFLVTISVKSFPDKQIIYASGQVQLTPANKFQGSVTLTIQPKDLRNRDPDNLVTPVYLEAVSPHFTKEKKMRVTYENGFLFIQTDKPIYTPDQSVKVRLFSLNEELRPARRSAILTFVDPEEVEVDIIKEEDFTGVISFPDFKIPPYPKYGTWTIKARYEKDFITTAEAKFQVKEYAMPSFSVTIEPEKNFISAEQFESFHIVVKASYFYNKRVTKANVYIRYGIMTETEKTMMPKAVRFREMDHGVAEFTFNSKAAVSEIGYHSLEELNGLSLHIAVSVLESTGGHSVESELAGVKYVLSPYKLNLIATPLFVKPGLPFYIKVQVKDTSDEPVRNIPVIFTASVFNAGMEETTLVQEGSELGRSQTSQNDGTALFVVNVPPGSASLEFHLKTADAKLPENSQATKTYMAKSYVSLSGSYLYIDWALSHKMLHVGESVNINVHPLSHYAEKIHHYSYLILSKGKIIKYGTQERIKDSVYQSLSFQITHDMVPSARLLVYYIVTGEGTAELVADSAWLNIEQKCENNIEVRLSKYQTSYKPGQVVSLAMTSQFGSLIALSSMDKAIYGITGRKKRPIERALLQLEKSDLGCGAGGGQNNVDVFRMAGLTFLTNANAEDSKEADEQTDCQAIVRSVRSTISEQIEERVSRYKHKEIQKCCRFGAQEYPISQTCSERAKRIRSIQACINAFKNCCEYANELRQTEPHKVLILARMQMEASFGLDDPVTRSYFPESWLWEVHQVDSSKALSVTLPDSLTTWEIQGVGISDKGICVADALQVEVVKDLFLSVYIPYSVVRGEQIELRGSVYNYRNNRIRFCSQMSADKGICLFRGSSTAGRQINRCDRLVIEGSSVALVKFKILPLEIGLHTVNFTLKSESGSEIVVRTLRVVPEGIRKEIYEGRTLDPQGVYGTVTREGEFRHRLPLNMVPKTRLDRTVSIKGHLLGEVITTALDPKGVKFLSELPKGSAETELMNAIPVFYVYYYLAKTNSWDILGPETLTTRTNMRRRMREGIVRILSFQKRDFSYSMWKDGQPSAWLTAFALRILGQVSSYASIEKSSVCNSLTWLTEICQMDDGSFREVSSYQPVKLQGTLPKEQQENTLYLTAFSLIGITKAIHLCPLQKIQDAKNKAEDYLLQNFQAAQSTFSLAIVTYALTLARSNQAGAHTAYAALRKEALMKGDSSYRFWKDTSQKVDQSTPSDGTAKMVETTAYALLSTLLRGDQAYANPIVRWLSEQQRYGGGFYSTQDTINALEALTEYSILIKRLVLDMSVKLAYKNRGDFYHYRITKSNYIGKPVEAPLYEDIQVRTGSNTGLATVNVRNVYYKTSTSEDTCNFELKIEAKLPNVPGEEEENGDSYRQANEPMRLIACAKYKPSRREPKSASSHAVLDISLVSGLDAYTEDLSTLSHGVDQLIANYEIKDGHVIAQVDSIPAGEFLCIGFRVAELFRVGMPSPGTFTVYEYHDPDKRCTIFYNPYGEDSLVKLCEGSECKCMEAECGRMQNRLDLSIGTQTRSEAACQNDIAYVYKVNILSSINEGSFVKYTATLLDLYKRGEAFAQKNAEIVFIRKKSCTDVQLSPGENYLIMGKEALKMEHGASIKYQYPLDAMTWIEWWPSASSSCPSCQDFVDTMEDFAEDLFINGC